MSRRFSPLFAFAFPLALAFTLLQTACSSSKPTAASSAPGDAGTTATAPGFDAGPCPLIQTAGGPVAGAVSSATCAYEGIPYAAPPVGDLRWKPPQPAASWTSPRPSAPGFACAQGGSAFGTASNSEDCLYLNVWVPTASPPSKAPVLAFVHGGSFLYGSGTFPLYDGAKLAAATGNVVVTLNYRLGALGFLSNPALRAEDPSNPTAGDYGILDQIAALQWVKANVGAFGGDPSNVTIFGQSAGGTSMYAQLVSPLSAGLFARAIVESGAAASGGTLIAMPQATADANGATFASALGCTDASTLLSCLRGKSVADILGQSGSIGSASFWAVTDGVVIPSEPLSLFASGKVNKVPVIVGSNANEGKLFLFQSPPTDAASYLSFANGIAAGQGAAVVAQYPVSSYGGSYLDAADAVMTDGIFRCPARRVARGLVAAGVPTFRYEFVHDLENPPIPNLGAFHGAELAFIFGNPFAGTFSIAPDEQPLQTLMRSYWSAMAKSGAPTASGAPAWPAYDLGNEAVVVFDTTTTIAATSDAGAASTLCDFWDQLGG
jgi:para-nitrobenzyl esterase